MKSLFTLFSLALFCLTMSLGAQDLQDGLVMHYPLNGNLTDTISGITADNNGNPGHGWQFFQRDAID